MTVRHLSTSLAAVVCLSTGAVAQEIDEIPFYGSTVGSAALGGALRMGQNPYIASDDDQQRTVDLLPLYLYEGRYVFFRGAAGGLHIVKNDRWEVNLYSRYRFQKLNPSDNEFFDGLEEREQSLDVGFQISHSSSWGKITAGWLTDALDRHNGQEVEFSYRYNISLGPWSLSPFIRWAWQDEDLTNYYFGVSPDEARPGRPVYSPGESQWLGFGLNSAWQVSDRISLFGNFGFSGTESDVVNSPLVEERGFSGVFVGGTYTFGNVRKPDYIMDAERMGEWSWRINYGYQADGNIVSEIDQGDFSKSSVADTNIAGLTLGKLIADGKRVDFVGKLAMFRHLESSEGNGNFWSWAAFIMARGSGYSPWTDKEVFRWGFGFGMSYAEKVPIAEQRKQTGEGAQGNTSHFLNYLEMTLDFPLRRVSKADWLQNCYAGVSVVHRSGIFGTSDFLGDVSGGSDWISAHLECTR